MGNMIVNAYNINFRYGFKPIPAYVTCYSSFSNGTISAVHNGCLAWNGAGQGDLIFRTTSTHTTTIYPRPNSKNEITKGERGTNEYLMQTCSTPSGGSYATEADIDINVSHDFGTADTSYDTRTVMTHELGHVLGLDEDYTSSNNVMYWARNPGEEVYTLSADDKAGIANIYGR